MTNNNPKTQKISPKEAEKVLSNIRKKLLDLTLRNKLLNCRVTSKTTKQFLLFAGTEAAVVEERLGDNKAIRFAPVPAPKPEEELRFGFKEGGAKAGDWADFLKIPTWREPSEQKEEKTETKRFDMLGDIAAKYERLKQQDPAKAYENLVKKLTEEKKDFLVLNRVLAFYGFKDLKSFVEALGRKDLLKSNMPEADKLKNGQFRAILFQKALDGYLKNIYAAYKSAAAEMGIGTLYVMIGFLEWKPVDSADKSYFSPLLIYPVVMDRSRSKTEGVLYEYTVSPSGDELQPNVSLEQLLNTEYNINLPPRRSGQKAQEESLDAFFEKVSKVVSKKKGWKVHKYIALGNLDFAKLMMYEDLKPESWSSGIDTFLESSLLSCIFQEKSDAGSPFLDEDYAIDERLNLEDEIPLIDKADSSQHSALIDAICNGKDIVIEGPPGTGKSQTITNLIAAALYNGKKVLFVSEKTAALEVVKRRMDKAGLGVFCLTSHQTNTTTKKQVLEDLKKRLELESPFFDSRKYKTSISRYEKFRDRLNYYACLMNSVYGKTELTMQEILSAAVRYKSQLPEGPCLEDAKEVVSGENFTPERQNEYKDAVERLIELSKNLKKELGGADIHGHPWFGAQSGNLLTESSVKNVENLLNDWQSNLFEQKKVIDILCEQLGVQTLNLSALKTAANEFPSLPSLAEFDKALSIFKADEKFKEGERYLGRLEEINEIHKQLREKCQAAVLDEIIGTRKNSLLRFEDLGIAQEKEAETLAVLENLAKKFRQEVDGIIEFNDSIKYLKDSMPDSIASRIVSSREGYEFLLKFLRIASSIEPSLVNYRHDGFDDILADQDIKEFSKELAWFAQTEKKLGEIFDIEKALEVKNLLDIYKNIKDSGFFSFFSGEFRENKARLLAISVNQRLNIKEIASHLPEMEEFRCRYNLLNAEKASHLQRYGNLFKGRKTNPEDLVSLRKWYKAIREAYGNGFGPLVQVGNDLIALNASLLNSLISQGPAYIKSVESALAVLSRLSECLIDSSAIEKKNWGESLKEVVQVCDSFIENIGRIKKIYQDDGLSGKDIRKLFSQCEEMNGSIAAVVEIEQKVPLGCNVGLALTDKIQEKEGEQLRATVAFAGKLCSLKDGVIRDFLRKEIGVEDYTTVSCRLKHWNLLAERATSQWNAFSESIEAKEENWFYGRERDLIDQLIDRNKLALNNTDSLKSWSAYISTQKEIEHLGINAFLDKLLRGELNPESFTANIYAAIYCSLSEEIVANNIPVFRRNKIIAEQEQHNLKAADEDVTVQNRNLIASRLLQNPVPAGTKGARAADFTELALIQRELSKTRSHIPLRQLFARAPKAILALKPCWMMSPLAVAKYLTPGIVNFDLIVMDEASQIRPEDALGTLLRARKAVIVGDSKQLPPTSFFVKTGSVNSGDGEEEEDEDSAAFINDDESILTTMSTWLPKRMLKWHYRSRHESLIEFSNQKFYNNKLVVFPSPCPGSSELGLLFTYIESGYFEKGINREEANVVVEAVIRHAKEHPEDSLAVVTMNSEQQNLIEELLEAQLINDPKVRELLEPFNQMDDPLIIKNLENIQGDERDVIFISCTYGKEKGSDLVPQRFGPINKSGGWRRLNVLFTRARKRMHIFSSMRASDIRPSETSTSYESLSAFHDFLRKADDRQQKIEVSARRREPDSDFEIAVADRLREKGYKCEFQVGTDSYYIDLAVVDPNNPGQYLMGIECDGAAYHSAKSARDRDALRQQILENLGWKIRRIWSTDWYTDPTAALRPILQELEELVREECKKPTTKNRTESSKQKIASLAPNSLWPEEKSVEERLENLRKEMEKLFPDIPYHKQLLRKEVMELLLEGQPTNREEFAKCVPQYLRTSMDSNEAAEYLDKIFKIFEDNA